MNRPPTTRAARRAAAGSALALLLGVAGAASVIEMTLEDFHAPGTQVFDVPPDVIQHSENCRFCHAMVDPIYVDGTSPIEDLVVHDGLEEVPSFYGDSMFVLDPSGTRRGARVDAEPPHALIRSPFHATGEFCGTCHDVGNLAVSRLPDGTYAYNAIDARSPHEDPWLQLPLERTYTEWKLSDFANGGVAMGGRFGGEGADVVSTCQDCHMPRAAGRACVAGPDRPDVRRHEFAGAAVGVLDMIALQGQGDPNVDQDAIAAARAASISMLERAASLELGQSCGSLRVRVVNESGHEIPTGHIEGRAIWVNERVYDEQDSLVMEYGRYDEAKAHLDATMTEVYEMLVGLSEAASDLTGYPAGVTAHMALADVVVKDNRIPPRGYDRAAYEAGGAMAVGASYADGQHWDDSWFALPEGAARAEVRLYYQNLPRHYIETLRDNNVTDDLGGILHELWIATGRGEPILMADDGAVLDSFVRGDLDCDGIVDPADLFAVLARWGVMDDPADLDGDRQVGFADLLVVLSSWSS